MKKKTLLILLSLILVLGLAACGGTTSETEEPKKAEDEASQGTNIEETNEAKKEEETPEVTETNEPEKVQEDEGFLGIFKSDETDKAKKVADTLFDGIKRNEENAFLKVADKETKATIEEEQKRGDVGQIELEPEEKVKQDLFTSLLNRIEYTYLSGEVAEGADTVDLIYNINGPMFNEYLNKITQLTMEEVEITKDSVDVNAIPMKEKEVTVNMVKEDGDWKVKDPTGVYLQILDILPTVDTDIEDESVSPDVDDNE